MWIPDSALEIAARLRKHSLGCVELTRAMLQHIRAQQPAGNAFITIVEEQTALEQAARIQKKLDAGDVLSPLAGVPMALKDNLCTRGIPTTCASRMLQDYVPPYAATAVQRLEDAGAILLGKTNMDEFAMGSSNETSCFGAVCNPWDRTRVPGGSSGGAAAAVADGLAAYALGSDTGGSIRQPCSFCGVSGILPTYGRVSRYGLVAFASSLDQIGPIGRTVEDCAAVLSLIAGHDPKDASCAMHPAPEASEALDVRGLRIGLPHGWYSAALDNAVAAPIFAAAKELERLGAVITEVELPLSDAILAAYYVLACAEASTNLGRYDGVRFGHRTAQADSLEELYIRSRSEGFGSEVKRRILLGTFVLSAGYYDQYYIRAQKVRRKLRNTFAQAFSEVDLLLAPCTPTPAFRLGEKTGDPLEMYRSDQYTLPVNLAGLPAVALPCGFAEGLPVGMQLIGPAFSEPLLCRVGQTFQQHTDYHCRRPGAKGGVLV